MTRRISLITGSRAEYGHLRWLAREIAEDTELELQWLVTGSHLCERFGLTYREIEADGFTIDERVDMPITDDSTRAVLHSMGHGLAGMADALQRLSPDIVVIVGDRYEMLVAAEAALVLRLPIAHLHGGETTEGAFDEAIRHAITKMAHLHFVAAEPYRRRVIQLGEDPHRVHHVGAPGLDNIDKLELLNLPALENAVGFRLGKEFFLVTYHPVTLAGDGGAAPAGEMLAAFDAFPERQVLITGVNADPGFDAIASACDTYAKTNPERAAVRDSLGETAYLSAMKQAAVVVGNSSSGIIQAPAIGVPTVNIGDRQKGRLRAASVIDCGETRDAIEAAIRRALDPAFRASLADMESPNGRGGASRRIKYVLKNAPLDGIIQKQFHDMGVVAEEGTARGP